MSEAPHVESAPLTRRENRLLLDLAKDTIALAPFLAVVVVR